MTVKELMEYLSKFNPMLEVRVIRQDHHDPVKERDIFVANRAPGVESPHLLIS